VRWNSFVQTSVSFSRATLSRPLGSSRICTRTLGTAGDAGWSEQEIANALIELAHHHWFAIDAKDRMFEEVAGVLIQKAKSSLLH